MSFEKVAERNQANHSMVKELFCLPKLARQIPITWRNNMLVLMADCCFESQGWEVEVGGLATQCRRLEGEKEETVPCNLFLAEGDGLFGRLRKLSFCQNLRSLLVNVLNNSV